MARQARRLSSRPRLAPRPRFACEPLEDRITPALGDLLFTFANPTPAEFENLGLSVAVTGNLAVVGAPNDDPGGVLDAGSVYVFDLTTGALVHTLANPDPDPTDFFGSAVAAAGNFAVVGAWADAPGGVAAAGSAYVFDLTTGALLHTLADPTPVAGAGFGQAVAAAGTFAVVGAPDDSSGGVLAAGAVHVFDLTTGAFLRTLSNPDPTAGDDFGGAVAASGTRAVVGASRDDPGGVSNAGSAYVFDLTTGAVLDTLASPGPIVDGRFGYAVAAEGDRAVVGAPDVPQFPPVMDTNVGAAYVFDLATGNLVHTLANPDADAGNDFGASVALSGNRVVVGMPTEADAGGTSGPGMVHVFDLASGALLTTINNPAPAGGDRFGWSVAAAGGRTVVGAPGDDPGGVNASGAAFAFDLGTTSPPVAAQPALVGGTTDGTARVLTPSGGQYGLGSTVAFFAGSAANVRVATADVTGDGVPDHVGGTGPGVTNQITVIDGATQKALVTFSPFESSFTGGVFVAAADLDGDGKAEVVVTPDQSGGPLVAIYRGSKLAAGVGGQDAQVARFFGIQGDPNFRGGARPALGDLNGDTVPDLVVAAGVRGGPRIALFDGAGLATGGDSPPKLRGDFFVFEETLRNGAFVAAGDVTGDGRADLAFGGGPRGAPRVRLFDGQALLTAGAFDNVDEIPAAQRANFFAGDPTLRGGVRLALRDADGNGTADLLTGSGEGEASRVRLYTAANLLANLTPVPDQELDPFGAILANGVFVG